MQIFSFLLLNYRTCKSTIFILEIQNLRHELVYWLQKARKPGLESLILEPESTLEADIGCPKKIFLLQFFGLNQLISFPARFLTCTRNPKNKVHARTKSQEQRREEARALSLLFGIGGLIGRDFSSKRKSFWLLVFSFQIHCSGKTTENSHSWLPNPALDC